jgi:peroxiredoxin family protein
MGRGALIATCDCWDAASEKEEEMDETTVPNEATGMSDTLSLVLFSGTDDRLEAAAVLVAGAAVMGRKVKVFLQYWALNAFRAGRIEKDHGLSAEATPEGSHKIWLQRVRAGHQHWSEILRRAKELGDVQITACALSMDTLGLTRQDLDALVDGIEGVASFMSEVTGPLTFV